MLDQSLLFPHYASSLLTIWTSLAEEAYFVLSALILPLRMYGYSHPSFGFTAQLFKITSHLILFQFSPFHYSLYPILYQISSNATFKSLSFICFFIVTFLVQIIIIADINNGSLIWIYY